MFAGYLPAVFGIEVLSEFPFGGVFRPRFLVGALVIFALGSELCASASVLWTNPPALPLTAERLAKLPARQRGEWEQYLQHSDRQMQADQAFFRNEMRENGINQPSTPPGGQSTRSVPLFRPAEWYGSAEARKIADIVVSFQTPAGGWSKNLDMSEHRRAPGERFAVDNASLYESEADFDAPHDLQWNYVGTFDNGATVTELRFLAKVIAASEPEQTAAYRAAFLHGLDYIFAAQYPNGGWPQVWPLQGGYHDTITFNDDAMTSVLRLLENIIEGKADYTFVPEGTRALARESVKHGVGCILACQIRVGSTLTVWCQQHDELTLQPASARNYEMPSEVSAESARIMMFLMDLRDPGLPVVEAVHAAAAWFQKTQMVDVAFRRTGDDRRLVTEPGGGSLWARYYEIGTDRPIFGDRDKTVHDTLTEVSLERRRGYGWYVETPAQALEAYSRWCKIHPQRRAAAPRAAAPKFIQ